MPTILCASNAEEFIGALSRLDIHIPARRKDRKKDQTERYDVAHLLASLPPTELSYPLSLLKRERPDFLLTMGSREIGIEVVDAVPENHVRASILLEEHAEQQLYFPKKHRPGELRSSKNSILHEITQNKGGPPYVGNEVEVRWTEVMLHFIKKKNEVFNKLGFAKFEENWLLIYKNWPLPGVRHEEASSLLNKSCLEEGLLDKFSRIFVLDSKFLCEFGKNNRQHPVISPNRTVF